MQIYEHNNDELKQIVDRPQYFHDLIKVPQQQTNINDFKTKTVFLYGFPFDEGTRLNGGRVGGEQGSAVFRNALIQSKIDILSSPDYDKFLEQLQIIDYGDVKKSILDPTTYEQGHDILYDKVKNLLQNQIQNKNKKQYAIPFVIGGSNDQSYPNAHALLDTYSQSKIAVINLDAHFDVRPLLENGKPHSGSPFRELLENKVFQQNKSIFIEFAAQGSQCSQSHFEFIKSHNGRVYWLDQQIRKYQEQQQNQQTGKKIKTQAGQLMQHILNGLVEQDKVDGIFFSFDVDSINSAFCPGVSCPSVIGGLTEEEAIELSYLAGRCPMVKLVDMSEFNPSVEYVLTGQLLVRIFYSFCQGIIDR